MTKAQDYTKMFQDMMAQFPTDLSVMNDAAKSTAAIGEQFSKVALAAAEASAEISNQWTKDTLAKMADVTKAQEEPADYSKAVTDFASAQVEAAAEHMAAFAEVAKKVQAETVELVLNAGKEAQNEAADAVNKATKAVKKAAKAA